MNLKRFLILGVSLSLIGAGIFLTFTGSASAHERRNFQSYTLVVGWVTEPAYVNLPNAVDLRVSRTADASPVTGLAETVKVEVTQGDKKVELPLRARFNVPGAYDGRTVPTAVGVYSFRFTGTIEGNTINETFTSGPNTFGSIEAPQGFPNALPLSQELEESLGGLEQRVVNLESADSGDAGTAMTVGIIGVVVGALGLGLAGYSLTRKSA